MPVKIIFLVAALLLPSFFAAKGKGVRGYWVALTGAAILLCFLFLMTGRSMELTGDNAFWLAIALGQIFAALAVGGFFAACFFKRKPR